MTEQTEEPTPAAERRKRVSIDISIEDWKTIKIAAMDKETTTKVIVEKAIKKLAKSLKQ